MWLAFLGTAGDVDGDDDGESLYVKGVANASGSEFVSVNYKFFRRPFRFWKSTQLLKACVQTECVQGKRSNRR